MAVSNCAEIGNILQECLNRLRRNNDLLRLLYNTDMDPLDESNAVKDNSERLVGTCSDEIWKKNFFNKLIKVVPRFDPKETARSMISLEVIQGIRNDNDEFRDILIAIHVLVPLTQWLIIHKDTNLRPFAIMGEIQKSLDRKKFDGGIGQLVGGDFEINFFTDEVGCYTQTFRVTSYD